MLDRKLHQHAANDEPLIVDTSALGEHLGALALVIEDQGPADAPALGEGRTLTRSLEAFL